ncbi:CDP-alcohol phosphatidyltransferase family protein [Candidatus Woesearchaeota archaeon]|nr:CDP-alcohol phosphatidyltransferase family protein [Candidatus Woesearchaeota archaeon]
MATKEINIPNALTVLRLLITPFILYFILVSKTYTALILFAIAVFTDGLDGYLARKNGQGTPFGRIMDPISDKILFGTGLLGILITYQLWYWLVFFGVLGIVYVTGYVYFIKKELRVAKIGKIILGLEFLILAVLIWGIVNNYIFVLLTLLMAIPAFGYFFRGKK